jgi:hypothetical protein
VLHTCCGEFCGCRILRVQKVSIKRNLKIFQQLSFIEERAIPISGLLSGKRPVILIQYFKVYREEKLAYDLVSHT